MLIQPELTKVRGEILESFISIEISVGQIICLHYFNEVNKSFLFEVLGDEYFSFGLKVRILERITGKQFGDLRELSNIRNIFSHCGGLLFDPEDGKTPPYLTQSTDWKNPIDFEQKKLIFYKKYPDVLKMLETEIEIKGGRNPKQTCHSN